MLFGVFDIYIGKKYVKKYIILFKIDKNVFKLTCQIPFYYCGRRKTNKK